jgi:predicted ester cyclase
VIRVAGRGTHEGEFQGIPPTGRQVAATGVGIGRIQDGRIAEAWAAYDALGVMQQLGAIPAP